MTKKKVLVAGASGYLGKYLLTSLKKQNGDEQEYETTAIVRNVAKFQEEQQQQQQQGGVVVDNIVEAEVTKPETLHGICTGIDYVISSVGITRQKDGVTYMDVDYQANKNLLTEALKAGVQKFIYISVLNGDKIKHLKMIEAKEKFVDELKATNGIHYFIVRPNGFFSDMGEILDMAKEQGTIYLFGDGNYKTNPIHGEDLANFIVSHLDSSSSLNEKKEELDIGGPDLMTLNEIANIAFETLSKTPKIVYIPLWIRNISLSLIRFFTGQMTYGPIEFFMTVSTMDMTSPQTGNHHLSDYFKSKKLTEDKK